MALSTLPLSIKPEDFGPSPRPFRIEVQPELILEARQKASRYRPSVDLQHETSEDWSDGVPATRVAALAKYWAESYDWNKVEERMNSSFHHFTITIPVVSDYKESLPLHFVHERSNDESAIPLLLLHGWPSTHLEWEKVIKPLTSGENGKSYHIVAPDLPGFGFSPAPTRPGLGPREMGFAMDALMAKLGYGRYGIVSTDLGWWVAMWMVHDVGSNVIGHFSDFFLPFPTQADVEKLQKQQLSEVEAAYTRSMLAWGDGHTAYSTVQTKKPLALAAAMADSPVGYAAWLWHLMHTVCDDYDYSHEEIITATLMLWIQGPYGNLRTYKEFFQPEVMNFPKTSIPTGVSQWLYPNGPYPEFRQFSKAPREWLERTANIVYLSTHNFGGHFPAVSVPGPWVTETQNFFETLGKLV